jgi:hypothetical protein
MGRITVFGECSWEELAYAESENSRVKPIRP